MTISLSDFRIIFLIFVSWNLNPSIAAESIPLTSQESSALDTFRKVTKDVLTEDYMKTDVFLIRWLRARSLNVNAGNNFLREALEWRRRNGMDRILEENFSSFEKKFPYSIESRDKDGRTVIMANFGQWELRGIVLSGQLPKLQRYVDHIYETAYREVREGFTSNITGKFITTSTLIIDFYGFNSRTHACVLCLQFYIDFVLHYERFYPLTVEHIYLINTPRIFESILQLVRPLMSQDTRKRLEVYGFNRKDWQPVLFKTIDPAELPKSYGGTKDSVK